MEIELNDFYNLGFGWICRHCESSEKADENVASRLLNEGESESKAGDLSTTSLARWADPAHQVLICPNCGISERASKS